MTDIQTLQLRQGVIRRRMAELSVTDAADLETRAEIDSLTAEFTANAARETAMIIAADQPVATQVRAEHAELRGLEERASLGHIFDNTRAGRITDGATRELQQALGMESDQIPLALFAYGGRLESRAAATITGSVETSQQSVIPMVFPDSISAFFHLEQPVVPVGDSSFPVLSTGATVHHPAAGGTAAESTGEFTVTTIDPGRVQASFRYRREDAGRFMELDASLRDNLNMAISSALDRQNIRDSTNGLFGSAGVGAPSDATAAATYDNYVSLAYDAVDGLYSADTMDCRMLWNPQSLRHAGGTFRGNNADWTAVDALKQRLGGMMTTTHIPTAGTTGGQANDQQIILRKGSRRDYINPIWQGPSIIFDEITAVGTGEILITAVMLTGRRLLRADGFMRAERQTA